MEDLKYGERGNGAMRKRKEFNCRENPEKENKSFGLHFFNIAIQFLNYFHLLHSTA